MLILDAQPPETLGVGLRLRGNELQPTECRLQDRPDEPVTPEAPLRQAAVDDADGNTSVRAGGHEVRPNRELDEYHQIGKGRIQESFDRVGEVEGVPNH